MLRIGIVGTENSHTLAYATILNVKKTLAGAKVVAVWGEEKAHTEEVAKQGRVPEIVQKPEDLIGKIDAAVVDHRHAKYHAPAATKLVEAGIPVMVDKPFTYTVDEGRSLLNLAKKKGVLVTSYSSLRYATGFNRVLQAKEKVGTVLAADFVGPCDIHSQYGGIFFYGIHQVEMMMGTFGPGVESVTFNKGTGSHHTATVVYANGGPVVTMHLIDGYAGGFGWGLYGANGSIHEKLNFKGAYARAMESFLRMLKTGKNDLTPESMLTSVAVLAALDRSMKSGKAEKLESVSL